MSVLVFLDQADGHIKKSSFEAASYAAKVAEQLGTTAEAIVFGSVNDELPSLGNHGIAKVHTVSDASLSKFDAQVFTKILAKASEACAAEVIVFSNNSAAKAIAPRLSVRLKAGLVSGAIALPDITNGFVVKKTVFSGKAFANIGVNTAVKIIALNPNSYNIVISTGVAEVVPFAATIEAAKVEVLSENKITGEVS
ncbi:MAG: electron transfer flavoprotein subunit alpha/FixB family protein, partial [Gloeobacteraceae cyanobacterium ES-bin-316]|nr:electron transfer flavoprotein subunit alpha/FixB family protein [Ferruginibacter sp.]